MTGKYNSCSAVCVAFPAEIKHNWQ